MPEIIDWFVLPIFNVDYIFVDIYLEVGSKLFLSNQVRTLRFITSEGIAEEHLFVLKFFLFKQNGLARAVKIINATNSE